MVKNDQSQEIEAVAISGPDGVVYAVPPAVMEQWRLPAETATAVRRQYEVAGYGIVIEQYQALGLIRFTPPNAGATDPPGARGADSPGWGIFQPGAGTPVKLGG